MIKSNHTTVIAVALLTCFSYVAGAADSAAPDAKHLQFRARANELYEAGKLTDALPIYEQLVAERPDDAFLLERYGVALASTTNSIETLEQRRLQRLKAREQLLRAKELGDDSGLLRIILEGLGDGTETAFSENHTADKLMRSGEAAFARGDMNAARLGYLLVLQEEPELYEATLFIGDTYYAEKKLEEAGHWFQKAIQIDPNRETAYRYWGDALMNANRMQEAREQFVNAIIAEPYGQRSRAGLSKWMQKNKLEFRVPQIIPGASVTIGEDKQPDITIHSDAMDSSDEKELGAWMIYATTKILWMDEKFQEAYPQEKTYRHSLPEEVMAYKAAIEFTKEELGKKRPKKNKPSQLDTLATLLEADLLESYILLFQPDEGITHDYAAYRDQYRDKLRRMIDYVAPNIGKKK